MVVVNHLLSGLPRWVAGMIESSPGLSEIYLVYEPRSLRSEACRVTQGTAGRSGKLRNSSITGLV